MSIMNLQNLMDKASEMALGNIWSDNAYKVNRAILKIDNKNCSAYTRLAKYYKMNENIPEARNMYLKALDIDPNNRLAKNNLNDIKKDEQDTETVGNINTTSELLKQAKSSMLKGRYKLAVKLYTKAYGMDPLLVYAVGIANAYKKMSHYDGIDALYKTLIDGSNGKTDIEAINNEFKTLRFRENVMAE